MSYAEARAAISVSALILLSTLLYGLGLSTSLKKRFSRWLDTPPAYSLPESEPIISIAPADSGSPTPLVSQRRQSMVPPEFRKKFRVPASDEKSGPPPARDERLPGMDVLVSEQGYRPEMLKVFHQRGLCDCGYKAGKELPPGCKFAPRCPYAKEYCTQNEPVLVEERPDWVLVYGDTNSTLAGALAAAKLHLPVAHVEAGLRSHNRHMPEEINRVLTDHLSEVLFAPTDAAVVQLAREGIAGDKVQQVGDVMYDAALVFGEARSTIISDGEADVMVGFEPLETLRALNKCNPATTVITNVAPLPPFTAAIGKGVYPDLATIQKLISAKTGRLMTLDANALAKEAGNDLSVNIVLLGALIKAGILPVTAESVKEAIAATTKKVFVETNLKAFELGYGAV